MNRLFVDTGGLVARVLPRDQYHSASLKGWGILEQVNTHLFSSEHVLDESISLLARHASASYAARWAREHLASQEITWLSSSPEDWQDALRWLDKFADQKLSFTDCLSFTLLRRNGIQAVFGFERHFEVAGFELWPEP